jgi:hypothetical protein
VREAPGGSKNPSTPVAAGRQRQASRSPSHLRRAAERDACIAEGTAPEDPAAVAYAVAAHRAATAVGLRRERRRRTFQREAGHARGWSEWPPARMACATRARRESEPPRASRLNTRKSTGPTSRNGKRARVSRAALAHVQHLTHSSRGYPRRFRARSARRGSHACGPRGGPLPFPRMRHGPAGRSAWQALA